MLRTTAILVASAVISAGALSASASASTARPASSKSCGSLVLSDATGATSYSVKIHGISCGTAKSVEQGDYKRAAKTKSTLTATFSGWKCLNTKKEYAHGGGPYVTVSCSASGSRSLDFDFQNT